MNDIAVINWSCIVGKLLQQVDTWARALANRILQDRLFPRIAG